MTDIASKGHETAGAVDALVIGAGPAGLTAALYLARYGRTMRVVHDGRSRLLQVPTARNVAGFPDGIEGPELAALMKRHAEQFGAVIETGHVASLTARGDPPLYRAELAGGEIIEARGIVLAAGVEMNELELDIGDHASAVAAGVLRYCPICDGFEHRGDRIAVLGSDLHGAAEAMFLRQYSDHVTLIPKSRVALTQSQRAELDGSDIAVIDRNVASIEAMNTSIVVRFEGTEQATVFDILYPALGAVPRTSLAEMLGIAPEADGSLAATAFADPLRPGCYAAGDLLSGLDQISVAVGQGAMAATRLHNWLRDIEGHTLRDQAPPPRSPMERRSDHAPLKAADNMR